MLHNEVGLITTFVLGIFTLIGALISLFFKSKDKIINFSVGLAFGVIVGLIVTDLVPEIIESLGIKYCYVFLFCAVIGFYILKMLDGVVPHHHDHYASHHENLNKEEKSHNLTHIGLVTTVALVIHNIIEGAAVYSSSVADKTLAMGLALGVGFHNIPLVFSNSRGLSTRAFIASSSLKPAPRAISYDFSNVIRLSGEWVSVSTSSLFPTSRAIFATCPFPRQCPLRALISK